MTTIRHTFPRRLRGLGMGVAAGATLLAAQPERGTAQSIGPNFDLEWRWVDFGPEDGLPSGNVRGLVELGDTVWVWSDGGIAFYDGFVWTPVEILPDVSPRSITSMSLGENGDLMIVASGRIFERDRGIFRERPVVTFDGDQRLERAEIHPAGGLVVSTNSTTGREGLYHVWNGGAERLDDGAGLIRADALWSTRAGRLWAGFRDGVAVLEGGQWRYQDTGDVQHVPVQVLETRSRVAYVAKLDPLLTAGMHRIAPDGSSRLLSEEGGHQLQSADITPDGSLGVFVYDTGDIRILADGVFGDLSSSSERWANVNFVRFRDGGAQSDLWIGAPGRLHLFRRSLSRWGVVRRAFPSQRNRVNGLLIDRTGRLWQATAGGVSVHSSPEGSEWLTEILGRPTTHTTTIAEAEDGSIWIGSGASFFGALRHLNGEWTPLGPEEGFDGGRVHKIVAGRDGAIWFATLGTTFRDGAGVYRLSADGALEAWSDSLGITGMAAFDVLDLGEEVWVAAERGVIRVRNGVVTEWSKGFNADRGTSGAFALARDPKGRTWFSAHPAGGPGGLGFIDDEDRMVWIEAPGGDAGQSIWSLMTDHDGTLWAGSSAGILAFRDERWSLFGVEAGLNAAGVWPLVVSEDQVLAGTLGGGVRALERREEDDPPPRVIVDEPLVDDRAVFLRWRANAFWGSVPADQIETRYQVDGGPWSSWTTGRELTLTGLGSGEHTVRVQGKGLFGQVEETPPVVTASLPPPLLLRPAFAGPVGVLVLALLVLGSYTVKRRREEERSRRANELRLRTLIESAPEAIGILDARTGLFIDLNENASTIFGMPREELMKVDPLGLAPERLPDGRSTSEVAEIQLANALAGRPVKTDWVVLGPDGEQIPVQLRLTRLPTLDGDLVRVSILDVREQVHAAEVRADLELQLRQAQKLEAMGKLTGGIAHDFNNLLTVIIGNLDLLLSDQGLGEDQKSLMGHALRSADRGADLTRRLLAFSRNQPLAPKTVELSSLLPGLRDLLQRTLPETILIDLSVAAELPPVTIDPSGFENAILNLVINSRDAMPEGGRISIHAAPRYLDKYSVSTMEDLAPGTFMAVSVSDDGVGMPQAVAERAFDPFFTTKEIGEGTGLGLSMVYGFVRQSGGAVHLYSEPGQGTTVRLFLPLATASEVSERDEDVLQETVLGKGEKILVVEDDEGVRRLLLVMLDSLGYQAEAVETAAEALARLRTSQPFDLVLSDIVLPGGMNGIELGRSVAKIRPGLPFLFASGYAEGSVLELAEDDPSFELLPKPFERSELSRRLRRKLDREPGVDR